MDKKIAFVTGATSGIGAACAIRFAKGGYDLVITGRDQNRWDAVKKAAEEVGAEVEALNFDVRDRSACQLAVNRLQGRWCYIDVLINNAGLALGLERSTKVISKTGIR